MLRVNRTFWLILVIVGSVGVCVWASACGRASPAEGASPARGGDSIHVFIDNQNFYDASVYLNFVGGSRRRLAIIRAYTEQEQAVRWDPSEFWFEVDFVGIRFHTRTRRMSVNPGEAIELQLTANAHRNGQLIVRRR